MGDLNFKLRQTNRTQRTMDSVQEMKEEKYFMSKRKPICHEVFSKEKLNRKQTRIASDRKTKNEIDYFLTRNKSIFEDVIVINRFTTGSEGTCTNGIKLFKKKTRIDAQTLRLHGDEFRRTHREN